MQYLRPDDTHLSPDTVSSEPTYPVSDCYVTVQGEGCMTGTPVVLLRLQGCAVGCHFCDTKYTWPLDEADRRARLEDALGENPLHAPMTPEAIVAHIGAKRPGPRWVLLTGGEPARYSLGPLVRALQEAGWKVMLETSGTADGHLHDREARPDWVCVSPKLHNPGGLPMLAPVVRAADELKMVVGKEADIKALEELITSCGVDTERTTVCLQPMSLSPRATELCILTCQAKGYRLSVQTHRLLGLR